MGHIICVVGPTASGKTGLAVMLAKKYNGEVLSCDSMQIYRGMDIGTAKPTPTEMDGIPHHMIDCVDPNEPYSVGRYVEEAEPILQDILARGKTVIIAGGTGLYVDSLISGRTFAPGPSGSRREELRQLREEKGIGAVLEFLRSVDPERAEKLNIADEKRILRAAEIYLETGKTATQHDLESRQQPPKYRPLWLGLNYEERQVLYDRINLRVELMLQQGLMQELDMLLSAGVSPDATSMQAIGYKEFLAAREGRETLAEAIEAVKQGSRRYAKRQLSWFRRNPDIQWLSLTRNTTPEQLLSLASAFVDHYFDHSERTVETNE